MNLCANSKAIHSLLAKITFTVIEAEGIVTFVCQPHLRTVHVAAIVNHRNMAEFGMFDTWVDFHFKICCLFAVQ
jgi:hypothetical protein